MRRYLILGGGLALIAAALAFFNGSFGLASLWVLLVGAALVMVPVRTVGGRIAAFIVGVVAAWGAFALRAAVLPDIPAGRALVAAIPILLVVGVAALSRGGLPAWAGLIGLTTFYGAYEAVFAASPTDFIEQSIASMTSVLLLASVGALVGYALAPGVAPDTEMAVDALPAGEPPPSLAEQPALRPLKAMLDLDERQSAGSAS
jgi:hypothetical protein